MKSLLFVLATVAACSGSSSVSIKDLPAQIQSAFCKNQVECQFYPDVATCNAAYQVNDDYILTMSAAVTAKRATYDADLGAQCVDEVASQGCTFTGFQPPADDPCGKMFTGLVAAGGSCFEQPECADQGVCEHTDTSCDPNIACCTGMCVAANAKAAIGATCAVSTDCVAGAYCAQTSMKCAALATAAGAACDGFDGCTNPMICSYEVTTNTFTTCYTPAARKATCDPNQIFVACADARDYCDATTMTCTQNVAEGVGCEGSNGAVCVGYDECVNAFCAPRPTAQMACVDQGGFSDCLGTLTCTNATCQQPAQMSCE